MLVVDSLNDSGQQMAKQKNTIVDVIENIASISEENAAGTQQLSATMEELASFMDELAVSGGKLKELSEDIHHNIERFK